MRQAGKLAHVFQFHVQNGITFFAIGTDIPKIANSILTSLAGHGDLNVGDSIGSVVTQITLILGLLPVFGHWLGKSGVEQMYQKAREILARDRMTRDVITIEEHATIEDVLELMLRYDVNRLPVVRDNVLVGIVARYDLLKLMLEERK